MSIRREKTQNSEGFQQEHEEFSLEEIQPVDPFCENRKEGVSAVLVYNLDRFSRGVITELVASHPIARFHSLYHDKAT